MFASPSLKYFAPPWYVC